MAKRFTINKKMSLDNKTETFELSALVDNKNKTFYFIVDSLANVESFCERLNNLNDENEQLKQTIKEAYESERTQIGRNVLRQLLEAIQ